MGIRLTEVGVPVVELDPESPWYLVSLMKRALADRMTFWFRGNPQQVFDAARQTDIRTVEVAAADEINEWLEG